MEKIRYVQLEPAAALLDPDAQNWSPKEFGCYWRLVLYLYCNDGKLRLNLKAMSRLCNCQRDFAKVWQKIALKFQCKHDFVRHKRVTKELKEAGKRRKAALKAAKARWAKQTLSDAAAMRLQCKGNERKRNELGEKKSGDLRIRKTTSPLQSIDSSSSLRSGSSTPTQILRFNEALQGIIRPRNQSDRTSFRNISNWLIVKIQAGEFNEEILPRVLEYAAEAVKGKSRNPAAVFTSLLKKENNRLYYSFIDKNRINR